MAKLNIIIADSDESYTRGLSEYINANHSSDFQVTCFTKADLFKMYIEQQPSADVLLVCPDLCDKSIEDFNVKLKIILSNGVLSREYSGFQVINKYSTGERLLGEVIHLYSKLYPNELRPSPYSKDTAIIGVYSPTGGSGKTTIAASLSIQCAELGMHCFYLNLESIQSTGVFFNSDSNRNLSYVFYYLKEKSKNLSFKMNGIKSTDTYYGVQYFNPPESPLEYEEIDSDELKQLIQGLKDMECYDYIFIDMSSAFDMKNLKIMGLCDSIVLISLQEPINIHKSRALYNEIVKLSDTDKDCISDKFINVVNRYKDNNYDNTESFAIGSTVAVRIPEYSRALIKEEVRLVIDDDSYRKAIKQLLKEISSK